MTCSSFVAVFNSVVLSYVGSRSEIPKYTCPPTSIQPTSDDSFCKRDQVIALNNQQVDTGDTKPETLQQHDNARKLYNYSICTCWAVECHEYKYMLWCGIEKAENEFQ